MLELKTELSGTMIGICIRDADAVNETINVIRDHADHYAQYEEIILWDRDLPFDDFHLKLKVHPGGLIQITDSGM